MKTLPFFRTQDFFEALSILLWERNWNEKRFAVKTVLLEYLNMTAAAGNCTAGSIYIKRQQYEPAAGYIRFEIVGVTHLHL